MNELIKKIVLGGNIMKVLAGSCDSEQKYRSWFSFICLLIVQDMIITKDIHSKSLL